MSVADRLSDTGPRVLARLASDRCEPCRVSDSMTGEWNVDGATGRGLRRYSSPKRPSVRVDRSEIASSARPPPSSARCRMVPAGYRPHPGPTLASSPGTVSHGTRSPSEVSTNSYKNIVEYFNCLLYAAGPVSPSASRVCSQPTINRTDVSL